MLTVKFPDPQLGVFCCGHIFRQERPVKLVTRQATDWEFLCGEADHNDAQEPYHVCVSHLILRDGTLDQLAGLPPDHEAERKTVGSDWLITRARVG